MKGSALAAATLVAAFVVAGCGDSPVEADPTPNPCVDFVGEIVPGDSFQGTLTPESCLREGWYHDRWRFEVESDQGLRFDLESDEFDPYLMLTDGTEHQIAADDDSGDGHNARLTGTLTAGSYILWASSVEELASGSYRLSVLEVEIQPVSAETASDPRRPW